MPKIRPIPQGMHALTPQVVTHDADGFIEFCRNAFDAQITHIMHGKTGTTIVHASLRVGDSVLFASDADALTRPTSSNFYLYVPDVDIAWRKAIRAGAKVVAPLTNMFWGDRWGLLEDPFGNLWQIATHFEDVAPDEMARRIQRQ